MIDRQISWLIVLLFLALAVTGCSSDGGSTTASSGGVTTTGVLNEDGIDTGVAAAPTTVAGKVTLSSVITAQSQQKAFATEALKMGKPGSKTYNKAFAKATASHKVLQDRALPSRPLGAGFSGGRVFLYDASHPEWRYPVAEAQTDDDGNYNLEGLINATLNGGDYTDGDAIPGGNYTLLAYTTNSRTNRPKLVALQSVISEFAGNISGVDLVAKASTAEPILTTMLGVSKHKNGTQTWGGDDLELAPNAAIQVSFSMAMNRQSMDDIGLVFASSDGSDIPEGVWTLSADWFTATYYLNEGQAWEKGITYSLTVNGADAPANTDGESGEDIALYNVYGKSLKLSGVGTWKIPADAVVDTQAPTAQIASPTLSETAAAIETTMPLRIASNERMDVNGLRLRSIPSLGAQPGVLFVGKNDENLFEYEFLLGESMKLNTTYNMTMSGGKDLAGNKMNDLTVSFSTVAATEGVIEIPTVESGATVEEIETAVRTADVQADVKDVFGKWVRAFNDRNLPQLQSLMSADFVMEYNTATGFDESDINRDGLQDLKEFSGMIEQAFTFWDFCGVKMTGSVADTINIVGDVADFEFTLTATTDNNSQDCKESAPDESLFATLEKINGGWYMARASEGIDTRGQEIQQAVLLELVAPDDATVHDFEAAELTFEWTAITDAAAYAWIVVDSRNPQSGMALILPPTMTSMAVPGSMEALMEAATIADVSEDFGFMDEFDPRPGVELYWQVAALGSNTVNDVLNDRATDLPKDVMAISELYRVKIAGEYIELGVTVEANGQPVEFSEFIRGFDVDNASEAIITVTTPRVDAVSGAVVIDGNTHMEHIFDFDENGVATVTVQLNQGVNHIGVFDGVPEWMQPMNATGTDTTGGTDPIDDSADGRDSFVEERFQIITTGGIAPVITIATVEGVNEAGDVSLLENDGWDFYNSVDAVTIRLTGNIDMNAVPEGAEMHGLNLNVWNDKIHANASRRLDVEANGNFSIEVEIFNGENWVGIHGNACSKDGPCQNFNANFGVKTGVGSVYIAPISDVVVTDIDGVVIAQKENWGNGGRWDVSAAASDILIISGNMEYSEDANDANKLPQFSHGSDGGWQGDRLSVEPDGSFTIEVELFHGWNYINFNDVQENWFNLDLFTSAGKEVIRPEIATIDGVAFVGGDVSTDQCTVTIAGTAMPGEVRLNWNGEKAGMFYWEEVITEADADGNFSARVPLVGSADANVRTDNFINVYDKNWNWMGVRVINTADCAYMPPMITVDTLVTDTGKTLSKSMEELQGWYDEQQVFHETGARFIDALVTETNVPVVADTVTIHGTSSVAGRQIGAEMQVCNNKVKLPKVIASDVANSQNTFDWSMTLEVYSGWNSISISDGPNWYNVSLDVDMINDNTPPPPTLTLSVFDGATPIIKDVNTTASEGSACADQESRFDAAEATAVTIKGETLGTQNGKGEWHAEGAFGRFEIVDGTFEFTIDLFQGHNWINVNDADWNNVQLQIMAPNGAERPQFVRVETAGDVAITHGGELAIGDAMITGTIYADPVNKTGETVGFKAERVDGWVSSCGYKDAALEGAVWECMSMSVSSDPTAFEWGALPITFDSDTGIFSFDAFVMQNRLNNGTTSAGEIVPSELRIEIRADGVDAAGNWMGHGHELVLNAKRDPNCPDCFPQERIWKPGVKALSSVNVVEKIAADKRFKALRSRGH